MLKSTLRFVELLAPARNYESGCDAILCGADAVYIGAGSFGARAAAGADLHQISRLCEFAHRFRVKVYVAMNTLLFDAELPAAEALACQLWEAGADALIVQDMAYTRMNLPPIPLHASTQMCNMQPERIRFLSETGFSRVILERALNLSEIRNIAEQVPVELEAFVHGAICVGYSGQCYMSRTMSDRSGNRGVCSQSCRLAYNLWDENHTRLASGKHFLSVRDMNATPHLEELLKAGVTSFKIEGRLKDTDYVRNVVSWYRRELDRIIAVHPEFTRASIGESVIGFQPDPVKSFTRGGTTYYLDGKRQKVGSFDTPKAMGEYIGKVTGSTGETLKIAGKPLSNADGICFPDATGTLTGARINSAENGTYRLNRPQNIKPGTPVYRNYDHRFVTAVLADKPQRLVPVKATMEWSADTVRLTLSGNETVTETITGTFEPAQDPEKSRQTLTDQLQKTGGTMFRITEIALPSGTTRFIPISVINALRRATLRQLEQKIIQTYEREERRPEHANVLFPTDSLGGDDNVTNALARKFYEDHGVKQFAAPHEQQKDLRDVRVMRMKYCLRREMDMCLQERPDYTGPLFLVHEGYRYELSFDCKVCEMSVIYRGKTPTNKAPADRQNSANGRSGPPKPRKNGRN